MEPNQQQQNTQQVITILQDAERQIRVLLNDQPNLMLNGVTVLKRLCNGYAHAAGLQMDHSEPTGNQPEEKIMLTHIAGTPINARPAPPAPGDAIPTSSEEDQFQEMVDSAIAEFPDMETTTILESFNELIIRGVAMKVGLTDLATSTGTLAAFEVNLIKGKMQELEADAKAAQEKAAPTAEVIKPVTKKRTA